MDKRILVGIISYLPNEPERRRKRLESHISQLTWIKEHFIKNGPIDLICIYQNYKQDEVPEFLDYYEYELYDHGLHIGPARNKILERFYETDIYDVCCVLDDDRLFYDYYDIQYFLLDLLNSNSRYIHLITTLSPKNMPFKEYNTRYEQEIRTKWLLQECPPQVYGIYILYKHMKQYKIYFEDLNIHNFEGYEDIDFMLKLFRYNIRPYRCNQLITKTLLDEDSTWVDDAEQRAEIRSRNLQTLCDKYSDLGIQRTYRKDGRFSGFTHPVCNSDMPKAGYFNRGVVYKTPDNLLYKIKYVGKTLF